MGEIVTNPPTSWNNIFQNRLQEKEAQTKFGLGQANISVKVVIKMDGIYTKAIPVPPQKKRPKRVSMERLDLPTYRFNQEYPDHEATIRIDRK